ncbi:ABC transporter substrate-binding protein [Janibacter anophelis]|uniref:ABC transporter substrate-binding protein n=1 Tax=Janibacter anophelis TaxID=319054 RepID=UPI000DEFB8CA|nr:ABC transporter substrate-binding protein [Janibacter anophelis]
MRRIVRGLIAGSGALAIAAGAAACTDEGGDPPSSGSATTGSVSGPDDRLTVVSAGPVQAWDPQRITQRQVAGFASRTWMRTLTAYAPATSVSGQRRLEGDLATSTGTASKDARTWTFTLRQGATWQDGSPVTCADVQYGVARSFDEEIPSSGYALTFLDIPKKKDGTSTYPGPLAKGGTSKASRALIEEAVECRGERKVVFHLDEAVGNFDEVVSLPEFAPYKESREGEDAVHDAFSSGPYKLQEAWTPSTGGTWVRNPEWSRASDPLRTPGPATILHKEGVEAKDAVETIIDGEDGGRTLALDPVPSVLGPAIDEAGDRVQTVQVDGQLVDYLAVNTRSTALRSTAVRRALAEATDRGAYTEARGAASGTPTWSLLGAALPSRHETVLDRGPSGDTATARRRLTTAKVDTPVRITVAYRGGGTMDDAMKALESGWEEAGFDVTLKPLGEDYFTEIGTRDVAREYDVLWANWGPDVPSASTVLPPLFDDRINLGDDTVGRDYGQFADTEVTAAMDKAAATRDREDRAKRWAAIDTDLLEDGVYIPLRQSRLTYAAGSEVTSLIGNPIYGGVPEIGAVGVAR